MVGQAVMQDMLIGLSDEPPEILTLSPYKEGLLWFSRNEPLEEAGLAIEHSGRQNQFGALEN